MKKYLVFGLLAAAALVSCRKEAFKQNSSDSIVKDGVYTTFNATFSETKTYLDGSLTPLWSDADKLIVNGVESTDEVPSSDGKSISFKVAGVESPFCVLSPASLYDTAVGAAFDAEGSKMTVVIPGTGRMQKYASGTYSPEGAIAAAYATSTSNIQMKSLSVFFKIKVSGGTDSENISKILIHQGDGSGIAGKWDITYSGSLISMAPNEVTSPVGYWCGPEGVAQGTEMLVGIPAYNYENGLIVSIQDVSNHFCNYTIAASETDFSLKGGHIVPLNAALSPKTFEIASAEDWNKMALQLNCVYQKADCDINVTADINADKLDRINKNFAGTLNGNSKTITKTASEANLFRSISGTVKNLSIAGEMDGNFYRISSLADTLCVNGLVENVTNKMNITSTRAYDSGVSQNYVQIGGLICVIGGGTLKNCSNEGDLAANIDITGGKMNMIVGGIAVQIASTAQGAVIDGCSNSGTITAKPKAGPKTDVEYIEYNTLAGIVGWVRPENNLSKITGCTNSGNISYKGDLFMDSANAIIARMSVSSGIVGIAATLSSCNFKVDATVPGVRILIENCSNTGTIHNCSVNYSATGALSNKIYTSGIVGAISGSAENYARIKGCTSTGDLISYDLTTDKDGFELASARAPYCQVVGGLAGIGSYVEIDGCKVNCSFGNGKRPGYAMAGAIGIAYRKFTVKDSGFWIKGKWITIPGCSKNISSIANAPQTYNSTAVNAKPGITGTVITGCKIGGNLYYSESATVSDLKDQSSKATSVENFGTNAKTVRGHGYDAFASDVTISSTTYITDPSQL